MPIDLNYNEITQQRLTKDSLTTYMTMEEPCSGIISSPPKDNLASGRNGDRIPPHRIFLPLDDLPIPFILFICHVKTFLHNLELVPVEMEGVRASVPVVHCQLNVGHVRIRKSVGLGAVNGRKERCIPHSQRGEDGSCGRFLKGDIIKITPVSTVVVSVEIDMKRVFDISRSHGGLKKGREGGIVDICEFFGVDDLVRGGIRRRVGDLNGVVQYKFVGEVVIHSHILHHRHGVIPVCFILRLYQDGVSLRDRERQSVDRIRLNFDAVNFNNVDVVLVKRNVEHYRLLAMSRQR